jgi:hypothetical protein
MIGFVHKRRFSAGISKKIRRIPDGETKQVMKDTKKPGKPPKS